MKPETFNLKLIDAKMLSPNVRHLAFERTDQKALTYTPGHFINFHLQRDEKIVRRSYSIASLESNGILEVAVSFIPEGFASAFFSKLQIGEIVEASGPFGRLLLREEVVKRYILVATGTGITPYRAMLHTLQNRLQADPNFSAVIIAGVRNRNEGLYTEDFVRVANNTERLAFYLCYSRETAAALSAIHERIGHVQDELKAQQLNPAEDIVYLCGNPLMIDDTTQMLQNIGFPIQNIRREKYISNGA